MPMYSKDHSRLVEHMNQISGAEWRRIQNDIALARSDWEGMYPFKYWIYHSSQSSDTKNFMELLHVNRERGWDITPYDILDFCTKTQTPIELFLEDQVALQYPAYIMAMIHHIEYNRDYAVNQKLEALHHKLKGTPAVTEDIEIYITNGGKVLNDARINDDSPYMPQADIYDESEPLPLIRLYEAALEKDIEEAAQNLAPLEEKMKQALKTRQKTFYLTFGKQASIADVIKKISRFRKKPVLSWDKILKRITDMPRVHGLKNFAALPNSAQRVRLKDFINACAKFETIQLAVKHQRVTKRHLETELKDIHIWLYGTDNERHMYELTEKAQSDLNRWHSHVLLNQHFFSKITAAPTITNEGDNSFPPILDLPSSLKTIKACFAALSRPNQPVKYYIDYGMDPLMAYEQSYGHTKYPNNNDPMHMGAKDVMLFCTEQHITLFDFYKNCETDAINWRMDCLLMLGRHIDSDLCHSQEKHHLQTLLNAIFQCVHSQEAQKTIIEFRILEEIADTKYETAALYHEAETVEEYTDFIFKFGHKQLEQCIANKNKHMSLRNLSMNRARRKLQALLKNAGLKLSKDEEYKLISDCCTALHNKNKKINEIVRNSPHEISWIISSICPLNAVIHYEGKTQNCYDLLISCFEDLHRGRIAVHNINIIQRNETSLRNTLDKFENMPEKMRILSAIKKHQALIETMAGHGLCLNTLIHTPPSQEHHHG